MVYSMKVCVWQTGLSSPALMMVHRGRWLVVFQDRAVDVAGIEGLRTILRFFRCLGLATYCL